MRKAAKITANGLWAAKGIVENMSQSHAALWEKSRQEGPLTRG